MKNARATAIETLLLFEESGGEPIDRIFAKTIPPPADGPDRDRRLVMSLVYGVLRWRGYLDRLLADLSSHPPGKMKPLTLAALRVGLYQLIFLDRIPQSAAICETIEALKQAKQPRWLCGFANGVLRSAARRLAELPPADRFAAIDSHPAWLVKRWRELFGEERCGLICESNNRLPELTLRIETDRIALDTFRKLLADRGIAAVPGRFAPSALVLNGFCGRISELPGYQEGFFAVQDEAAQLIPPLLGPFGPGNYLDACAGLGGKTFHLAGLLGEEAQLCAIEPNQDRLLRFRANQERLRRKVEAVYQGFLDAYAAEEPQTFQGILIDAPCSGLGVIRRHPEIRWSRAAHDLARYQAQQSGLLDTAVKLLAPGGILIYATCSIDPMENEGVVEQFLSKHSDLIIDSVREALPESARDFCDQAGFLKTSPEHGLDGFFAARLRKSRE